MKIKLDVKELLNNWKKWKKIYISTNKDIEFYSRGISNSKIKLGK
jgi:hypothetical protein